MEQQRDIANTERERVITESVNLKKKLELMNSQRQRDAKDLSAMRHVKEKAFQVISYVHVGISYTYTVLLTTTITRRLRMAKKIWSSQYCS